MLVAATLRASPVLSSTSTTSSTTLVDKADILIYQGDDYAATVLVLSPDGITPADITGYTPSAQIRRSVADADPDVDAQITAAVADAVNGQISLSISHTQTASMCGKYVWDLQLTHTSDGIILTILRGNVIVTQEVTRP